MAETKTLAIARNDSTMGSQTSVVAVVTLALMVWIYWTGLDVGLLKLLSLHLGSFFLFLFCYVGVRELLDCLR